MDVHIQEVDSQVQALDSKSLLDPKVMRQIVQACMKAIQENHEHQKKLQNDRTLTDSVQSDNH
jgi:hypothetical protein